jgi:hypothetical protein
MSALRWAALPVVVAGALTGNIASASADGQLPVPLPVPVPVPSPTPAPTASPAADSPSPPDAPAEGSVYVTTVTTTTTIINAPITVVAAPISTTVNTTNRPGGLVSGPARERFAIDLTGCGAGGARLGVGYRAGRAKVRLAPNASLVVRVNGRRVTTLSLPSAVRRVALRLRLARTGMLTIRRPSGPVLAVQGCTPA